MKSKDFIDRVKKAATDHKTLYVMGCFGAPLVGSSVNRYCTNHTYNQQAERTAMIRAAGNQSPPVFGFDCVNLIKGILWGWTGEPDKTYGGAKYAANGVPDTNADGMIQKCKDVTTDFSGIVPGEAVWMSGHIGVYIGDGLAVESTPRWANGAQITAVHNIGTKSGYNGRKWTKHGRLPYVDYTDQSEATGVSPAVVAPQTGSYTVGGSNEETIFNFCRQVLGMNVAGACGIVANIYRESGFKTTALGDGGTSYGICQWHASRYTNLKTWCAQNGKDYTSLDGQLWYLKAELEKSYAAVLSYIKAVPNTATGAYNAGYRWCLKFEIPADTVASSEARGELARGTYWPKYSGAAGGTSTPAAAAYTGKFKVGDVVQFNGDDHYVSAASLNAKMCRGGRATVTQVYPTGAHPYHLVRIPGGGATVYGWVDECDIAAITPATEPVQTQAATPTIPTVAAGKKFTPRTTAPAAADRHWLHTSAGGLNECILIGAGSCLPNCVGYAWGRFYEITGKRPNLSRGNAEDWYGNTADGYKRGQTPKLGAVICWRKGVTGNSSDGAGHVAIVEEIKANGDIVASNSGYKSTRFWMQTFTKASGYAMGAAYAFQGFIYPPEDYAAAGQAAAATPAADNGDWTPAVGDVVFYTGTTHYVNAESTAPKPCRGGLAKITQIYRLGHSQHPYHLIRVAGEGATVYGWVDAGSFTKA